MTTASGYRSWAVMPPPPEPIPIPEPNPSPLPEPGPPEPPVPPRPPSPGPEPSPDPVLDPPRSARDGVLGETYRGLQQQRVHEGLRQIAA